MYNSNLLRIRGAKCRVKIIQELKELLPTIEPDENGFSSFEHVAKAIEEKYYGSNITRARRLELILENIDICGEKQRLKHVETSEEEKNGLLYELKQLSNEFELDHASINEREKQARCGLWDVDTAKLCLAARLLFRKARDEQMDHDRIPVDQFFEKLEPICEKYKKMPLKAQSHYFPRMEYVDVDTPSHFSFIEFDVINGEIRKGFSYIDYSRYSKVPDECAWHLLGDWHDPLANNGYRELFTNIEFHNFPFDVTIMDMNPGPDLLFGCIAWNE